MDTVKTVGIAGTGVIGAGWATRMLGHGLNIIAYDPADGAEAVMRERIERGRPHMLRLMETEESETGTVTFTKDVKEMAERADWIQEAAPGSSASGERPSTPGRA